MQPVLDDVLGALKECERTALARRGVTSTSSALGVALANHVSVAAPAGLAASVTTSALAGAAPAGLGVWGALFVMSKLKIGLVSAVILGGLATGIVEVRANRELRAELRPPAPK